MNTHMTQQDQIGLGRSITWICPPCSVHHVHHVHRVQCPPRQRPRVGEVAWLRGEEKDEAEEEEEGMGEVAWLRGEEKGGTEKCHTWSHTDILVNIELEYCAQNSQCQIKHH